MPVFVTEGLNASKLHKNPFDKQVTPADVVSPSLAKRQTNIDMLNAAAKSYAGNSEQESSEQS